MSKRALLGLGTDCTNIKIVMSYSVTAGKGEWLTEIIMVNTN